MLKLLVEIGRTRMAGGFFDRILGRERPSPIPPRPATYASYSPGQRIQGKYLVERTFEGGMGLVYVVSTGNEQAFILKTIKPGHGDVATFMQEARSWVRLGRHQNIVPAFWADTVAGMPCVAAEYIAADELGRTSLRDHLNLGQVPLQRVIDWAAEFCYAMQHAADRGMVAHRDIKPENLLINSQHSLQVTDFGLTASRSLEWPIEEERQVLGGTPLYMAPEQWRGEPQDFRTDVYAFGLILFEAVFERRPWNCHSLAELRNAHLNGSFDVPSHPLDVVIKPATSIDPADRFSSPSAMLEKLKVAADRLQCRVPPPPAKIDDDRHLELYARAFLSATGNADHAMAAAQELTTRFAQFVPGWVQLGKLYMERGSLRDAGKATQEALDRDPQNSPAWNNMALVMSKAGHLGEAIKLFHRAIDCDPGNSGAMTNLAGAMIELGRSAEALQWCQRASKLAPDKLATWLPLGSLHANAGNARQAQHAFEQALACAPASARSKLVNEIRQIFPSFEAPAFS